jgi:hypothetical protein
MEPDLMKLAPIADQVAKSLTAQQDTAIEWEIIRD